MDTHSLFPPENFQNIPQNKQELFGTFQTTGAASRGNSEFSKRLPQPRGHIGNFQTSAATCRSISEFSKHPPQLAGALRNFPNVCRNCASHSELSNHPLQAVSEYLFPQTYYPKKQKVRWHPIGFPRTFLEKHAFALTGYSLQEPYPNSCACIL